MKLSEHFSLWEMTKSSTAARLGIDNANPPDEVVQRLKLLCHEILEPLRAVFAPETGFTVNSGYRCLELNRALNSKDTSQHVKGEAVDIEIPGISNLDLFEYIRDEFEFDQLILEFYNEEDPHSGWVHVSFRAEENRNHAFTIG